MRLVGLLLFGLALGAFVGACGATLGTVQKASEIAFTAAEAQCIGLHANLGPKGARDACSIEEERSSGVELVVVGAACAPASDAGVVAFSPQVTVSPHVGD